MINMTKFIFKNEENENLYKKIMKMIANNINQYGTIELSNLYGIYDEVFTSCKELYGRTHIIRGDGVHRIDII